MLLQAKLKVIRIAECKAILPSSSIVYKFETSSLENFPILWPLK